MPDDLHHTELNLSLRIKRVRFIAFDFDGVFTDNMVYVFEDGREAVRCSRSDGLGLRKLEKIGVEPVIVSTEKNPVVANRSKKLIIKYYQGVNDKLTLLGKLLQERGLDFSETAFVGNDINDLSCLCAVGLPIAVADAHEDITPYAVYRTRFPGGHGAVREICDLIANVKSEHENPKG